MRLTPRLSLLSLRVLAALTFLGVLLTAAVLATVTYSADRDQARTVESVANELRALELYEQAERSSLSSLVFVAAFFSLRREEFADAYAASVQEVDTALADLRAHTLEHEPEDAGRIDDLAAAHAQVKEGFSAFLSSLQEGNEATAFAVVAQADLEAAAQDFIDSLQAAAAGARAEVLAAQRASEAAQSRVTWSLVAIAASWGAVLLLAGIAGFRWVVRPVRQVEAAARAIAAGDVETRAAVGGPAELASLADSVNRMADVLVKRSEDLNAYLSKNLERRTEELEEANRALAQSEQRFRSLVQNATDMVTIVDASGQTVYASPSVERIMGYPEEEWRRIDVVSLFHPDDRELAIQLITGVMQTPSAQDLAELRVLHKDGDYRYIETVAHNLLHEPTVGGVVFNSRDVTERRQAADALQESERRFRSLVLNATDIIVIIDEQGTPTYASPSVERIMGYREDEWRGLNILSWVHPDDREWAANSVAAVIREPGRHPPTELRVRHADGTYRRLEVVAHNLLHDPAVRGVVYNCRDVTERAQAEDALRESEERFRSLVQNASDLITLVDGEGRIAYQSPSVQRVLGYEASEVTGRDLAELLHPDDLRGALAALADAGAQSDRTVNVEARLRHKDGSWRQVEIIATDRRHDASVSGLVLNTRDVTERAVLEEQLRHQAFHDPLTNLANRARFADRLEHALARALRQATPVSVLFIDLDNFKAVNDSLGHQFGDHLLEAAAERLVSCLRPGDTAARFGGDEFAIILEDTAAEDATWVADRIVEAFKPSFHVRDRELFVSVSIGVAVSEHGQRNPDELLRRADVAMYEAKAAGKSRYELYEHGVHVSSLDRFQLQNELQGALERGELLLHYQPIVQLTSGRLAGVEALLRWRHPTRGILSADQFVGLAEESGAIVAIGGWVLEEGCRQLRTWQEAKENGADLWLSVNVSARQLQQPGFARGVQETLRRTRLPPASLVLEITESSMMRDVRATVTLLRELRSLGVRIAIDDFGTGYSSLSYLRQFSFDILKMDKSFVAALDERAQDTQLARAIIDFGNLLHVETVAEGIERPEQLTQLRSLRCSLGQGFYFARPASPEQIAQLLAAEGSERGVA